MLLPFSGKILEKVEMEVCSVTAVVVYGISRDLSKARRTLEREVVELQCLAEHQRIEATQRTSCS